MMNRSHYIAWLGVAAAAGAAVGLASWPKRSARGGLLGAAAGLAAGAATAGLYDFLRRREVPLYSSSSPLYDEPDTL